MKNLRRKTSWLHLFILLVLVGAAVQGMTWADLRSADLRGADLHGADLTGANLNDADLRRAKLSRATMPDGSTHP